MVRKMPFRGEKKLVQDKAANREDKNVRAVFRVEGIT